MCLHLSCLFLKKSLSLLGLTLISFLANAHELYPAQSSLPQLLVSFPCGLYPPLYKVTLTKITNDPTLQNVGNVQLPICLGLLASFFIAGCTVLLKTLSSFGFHGTTSCWFSSDFSDCSFSTFSCFNPFSSHWP